MATYLITGANRGIGYEYCQQLLQRGDTPIAFCRETSPELMDLGIRVIDGINITSDRDVLNIQSELKGLTLDVLINNAAIIERVTHPCRSTCNLKALPSGSCILD